MVATALLLSGCSLFQTGPREMAGELSLQAGPFQVEVQRVSRQPRWIEVALRITNGSRRGVLFDPRTDLDLLDGEGAPLPLLDLQSLQELNRGQGNGYFPPLMLVNTNFQAGSLPLASLSHTPPENRGETGGDLLRPYLIPPGLALEGILYFESARRLQGMTFLLDDGTQSHEAILDF